MPIGLDFVQVSWLQVQTGKAVPQVTQSARVVAFDVFKKVSGSFVEPKPSVFVF